MATEFSENITQIYKDDNSSRRCGVFVIEEKLKASDIGFVAIASVCILAGLVLVFSGRKPMVYLTNQKSSTKASYFLEHLSEGRNPDREGTILFSFTGRFYYCMCH